MKRRVTLILAGLLLLSTPAPAEKRSERWGPATKSGAYSFSYPNRTLIGFEQLHAVKRGESLIETARDFGLGYHELIRANPGLDPFIPPPGTKVRIPTVWILPRARPEGIVINLSEMRLYYYFGGKNYPMVITFPVGIGREGFDTPVGNYSIGGKLRNPTWYRPPSARKENPDQPLSIPPGPDNPLGDYWLQLSIPNYGIHGTNRPWGLGRRVSRGCIRLYPEDIRWLFEAVREGTPVQIVRQAIKVGIMDRKLYVQSVLEEEDPDAAFKEAAALIRNLPKSMRSYDADLLRKALERSDGLPVRISK